MEEPVNDLLKLVQYISGKVNKITEHFITGTPKPTPLNDPELNDSELSVKDSLIKVGDTVGYLDKDLSNRIKSFSPNGIKWDRLSIFNFGEVSKICLQIDETLEHVSPDSKVTRLVVKDLFSIDENNEETIESKHYLVPDDQVILKLSLKTRYDRSVNTLLKFMLNSDPKNPFVCTGYVLNTVLCYINDENPGIFKYQIGQIVNNDTKIIGFCFNLVNKEKMYLVQYLNKSNDFSFVDEAVLLAFNGLNNMKAHADVIADIKNNVITETVEYKPFPKYNFHDDVYYFYEEDNGHKYIKVFIESIHLKDDGFHYDIKSTNPDFDLISNQFNKYQVMESSLVKSVVVS